MLNKSNLIVGWNQMLNREDWDLFATITFKGIKYADRAKQSFRYFFKYLNTPRQNFFSKFIKCWVFIEKNKGRRGVHIHSLIKGIHPSKSSLLERKCIYTFGESKILQFDSKKGACHYLSSKQLSPDLLDYDYLKINSHYRKGILNENSHTSKIN